MQRSILALLAVQALGSLCPPGEKHKADLTGLTCSTSSTSADSCGDCCENNLATCGGLKASDPVNIKCSTDTYHGMDAKWANSPATKDTFQEKCCIKKATCAGAGYTCPAGMKKDDAKKNTECAGDAASCAGATCCSADTDTCGSNAKVPDDPCNTAGIFKISGTAALMDDAWKATKIAKAADEASRMAACCGTQPNCKGFSCPAARKLKANPELIPCATNAAPGTGVCTNTICCEDMTGVCGSPGDAPKCVSSQYYPGTDTWKNKAVLTTKEADCCTTKATCAVAVCAAGSKKKANIDNLSCTGGKDSCASVCCEPDTLTCGGLTGISCPYGFFDESALWDANTKQAVKDAWNGRAATAATKNTACCTPKAICVDESTTTPSPAAVTTTPAAPVRLYSQHKAAAQQAPSQGANMLWLGVGAVAGMGVLMIVQSLRSRMQDSDTPTE